MLTKTNVRINIKIYTEQTFLFGGFLMNWIKNNYFLALFLGLNLIFITTMAITHTVSAEEDYQIQVEQGDSLWGLAKKYGVEDSKEDWVGKVIEMNNLYGTSIKPGDVIVVPTVSENYHLNYGTEVAGE